MQIDWVTVVAQIINFLILVLLLKRFLYTPIINAMERREQAIAAQQQEAEDQIKAAEAEAEAFRNKSSVLDSERRTILDQAKTEAAAKRSELLEQLRQDIDRIRIQWREEIQREQESFFKSVRQEVGTQVTSLARRVLAELANIELEQEIVRAFMTQLRSLAEEETQRLSEALQKSKGEAKIGSRFELPLKAQQELQNLLRELFGESTQARFVQSEELLCGISLQVAGYKLVWSIDDYLSDVEQALQLTLTGSPRHA